MAQVTEPLLLDSTGQQIVTALEGIGGLDSGHTIVNPSGIEMDQRKYLKFMNSSITDDSVNNMTIVTPQGSPLVVDSGGYIAIDYDKM